MQTQIEPEALWASLRSTIQATPQYQPLAPWLPHLRLNAVTDTDATFAFRTPDMLDLFPPDLHQLLLQAVRSTFSPSCQIHVQHGMTSPSPFASFLPDPRFTFSHLHTFSGNRLAVAAAHAISKTPGDSYNPFFVYSAVGLGKTHLLHALCHSLRTQHPELMIAYLSADQLCASSPLVQHSPAPRHDVSPFTALDVLLLDDIHRLPAQPDIEALLFSLFEHLRQHGKQIVISADIPPQALTSLSDSLTSRLQWGLVVEIEPPSPSARTELIRRKANTLALHLTDKCLAYLTHNTFGSIREIEGILHKLQSHATLLNTTIDLPLVERITKDYVRQPVATVSLPQVETFICQHFSITPTDLLSKTRVRSIAYPRQIAMYLAQTMTSASLEEIGRHFGGRDHSTVKHGCEKIKALIERDAALRNTVAAFRRSVSASTV